MIDKVFELDTKYDIQLLLDYIKLATDVVENIARMSGLPVAEICDGLCGMVERGDHRDNSIFA